MVGLQHRRGSPRQVLSAWHSHHMTGPGHVFPLFIQRHNEEQEQDAATSKALQFQDFYLNRLPMPPAGWHLLKLSSVFEGLATPSGHSQICNEHLLSGKDSARD